MLARKFYAVQALAIFSLFIITTSASAQGYRRAIHHINYSSVDSVNDAAHLQLSISQQDKAELKFRIAVLNPAGRAMSISIVKNNEDVLFSENATGDQYFNLFNFNQLEDGDYKVIVFNGKERIIKNIHLVTATTVDRQISIN